MRKLLSLIVGCALTISAYSQTMLVTNITTTTSGKYPIFTNRVNLLSVTVLSANNAVIEFFNQITNAPYHGTNVVIPSYVSKGTAQSNIVTSFIQTDTGITNWYTNAGLFTYAITNAQATNAMSPVAVFIGGSVPVTYNNLNDICETGLTIRATTNANIVLYYNFGR